MTSRNRPTDGELAILRVLWKQGACTVRQVQEKLGANTGYTTVLKLLQIMTEKGLVRRDEANRTHIYKASVGEEQTQRLLVDELLDKAFEGSAEKLVLRALSSSKTSASELAQIRKLIHEMEKERK